MRGWALVAAELHREMGSPGGPDRVNNLARKRGPLGPLYGWMPCLELEGKCWLKIARTLRNMADRMSTDIAKFDHKERQLRFIRKHGDAAWNWAEMAAILGRARPQAMDRVVQVDKTRLDGPQVDVVPFLDQDGRVLATFRRAEMGLDVQVGDDPWAPWIAVSSLRLGKDARLWVDKHGFEANNTSVSLTIRIAAPALGSLWRGETLAEAVQVPVAIPLVWETRHTSTDPEVVRNAFTEW
eukprot:gene3770-700_t